MFLSAVPWNASWVTRWLLGRESHFCLKRLNNVPPGGLACWFSVIQYPFSLLNPSRNFLTAAVLVNIRAAMSRNMSNYMTTTVWHTISIGSILLSMRSTAVVMKTSSLSSLWCLASRQFTLVLLLICSGWINNICMELFIVSREQVSTQKLCTCRSGLSMPTTHAVCSSFSPNQHVFCHSRDVSCHLNQSISWTCIQE